MTKTEVLVEKFERDMAKRSRIERLLLVIDQFLNVLILNGSQDETMSSHIGRRIKKNIALGWEYCLCSLLRKAENKHCKKSLGE